MAVDVEFEWDDRQFQAMCSRLIDRGQNLRPLMLEINEMLLDSTRERFSTKTAPDGTAWKPLKPSTLARKKGKGSLLVFDGYLRDLLRGEVGDNFSEIRSALAYSALHQLGGTSDMAPGPAAVEERPYMGLSDQDIAALLDLAGQHVDSALP